MINSKLLLVIFAGFIMCGPGCNLSAQGKRAGTSSAQPVRVATFDSRAVAIAWARSAEFKTWLEQRTAEAAKARQNGNESRAREIEAEMLALQKEIHQQGFGAASVRNILAHIEQDLPEIAARAGVDVILSKWDLAHTGPDVQFSDVTDELVALFKPDAATLKVIREIRSKPPIEEKQIDSHQH